MYSLCHTDCFLQLQLAVTQSLGTNSYVALSGGLSLGALRNEELCLSSIQILVLCSAIKTVFTLNETKTFIDTMPDILTHFKHVKRNKPL